MSAVSVRERPIIFTGPMVKAILEGRKTQTRRVLENPQPGPHMKLRAVLPSGEGPNDPCVAAQFVSGWNGDVSSWGCRYGRPGDQLWVRETVRPSVIRSDTGTTYAVEYMADGQKVATGRRLVGELRKHGVWTPSVHMPRWACRLVLEIAEVRVQRLQEISEEDALAEGGWTYLACPIHKNPERSFAELWDAINGKRPDCSWAENPWCWCISFRRIS